jgi:hypothetical protein
MSKTKIQLEYPYNTKWKWGYLNTNSEGRETLVLYLDNKNKTSTQYARYLLAVSLGRFLTDNEQVDHIDNDKTNNELSNLQILSPKENQWKSNKLPDVHLTCPVCKKDFYRTRSQLRGRLDRIEENDICCSRSCGGKRKIMFS